MRLIDANALITYCNNQTEKTITANDISRFPAVDAAPVVHGKWEYFENIYDDSTWVCSACNESWTLIDGTPQENGMKYCPNCGAKMDLDGLDDNG